MLSWILLIGDFPFSNRTLVVQYEDLVKNFVEEFKRISLFACGEFNEEHLHLVPWPKGRGK